MITSKCAKPHYYSDDILNKKNSHTAVCIRVFGADERNRTVDLLITNELLYQLSYIGLVENYIRAYGVLTAPLTSMLIRSRVTPLLSISAILCRPGLGCQVVLFPPDKTLSLIVQRNEC